MELLAPTFEITQLTPQKSSDLLGDSVIDFLELKSMHLKPKSIKTYTESLNELTKSFGADFPVTLITEKALIIWLSELKRTESGRFMVWQTADFFFRWFFDDDPTSNPMRNIHLKRPKKDPIKGITEEEVSKILKSIKGTNATRDKAIISVLFSSALRREEFCNLTFSSINTRTGEIQVSADFAKGSKFRSVFIGGEALRYLKKYCRSLDSSASGSLWRAPSGSPLTTSGIRAIITRACKDAKVPNYEFHDFRRGCALTMKRNGADIKDISHFLGHADLKTTERYLALDETDNLRTAVSFGPLK